MCFNEDSLLDRWPSLRRSCSWWTRWRWWTSSAPSSRPTPRTTSGASAGRTTSITGRTKSGRRNLRTPKYWSWFTRFVWEFKDTIFPTGTGIDFRSFWICVYADSSASRAFVSSSSTRFTTRRRTTPTIKSWTDTTSTRRPRKESRWADFEEKLYLACSW